MKKNSAPAATGWQAASGLASWTFQLATATYGAGNWTIVVRLVEDGLEVARSTASAKFR